MAHWKDAVVTSGGVEMLNEWLAGRFVKITSAYGGTGTVPAEELAEQTGLVKPRQRLHLLDERDGSDGKTIPVQVNNAELLDEYELNQVGVFAKLDAERNPEAEERLLFLMQDEKGVTIPARTEASFLLELYCLIGVASNGRFQVTVDAAGVVTLGYLRETLAKALAGHNADQAAHPDIRERMEAVSAAGGSVESAVAGVDARLTLLELMYRTQVSGNPFAVTFGDMAGLKVTGVWNAALKRLEF